MSGSPRGKAPQMAIRRLSMYYRTLAALREQEVESISSEHLSNLTGSTAAQVRRDLAYFGNFGRRGVGYDVQSLLVHMQEILGIGEGWPMALVGVGNLGSALLAYDGFPRQGFRIVEAFDSDPRRVGTVIRDIVVKPMDEIRETIQARKIVMALLAVPAKAAQSVTQQLVDAGVRCVLNFAPISLKVPSDVYLASVDLSIEVEYLSYLLRESVAEDQASGSTCSDD
ncbi:MAG: redox-sensing transcriptional repressor Rex [Chloroflexi bacterium]|nr:redox-sensing transcriptional repressor Rex [Chloroflexota bacterium]